MCGCVCGCVCCCVCGWVCGCVRGWVWGGEYREEKESWVNRKASSGGYVAASWVATRFLGMKTCVCVCVCGGGGEEAARN